MLHFKEYLKICEIASDTWLEPRKIPLEKYYTLVNAPTSFGTVNTAELPPTKKPEMTPEFMKIKNRLMKKMKKNNPL